MNTDNHTQDQSPTIEERLNAIEALKSTVAAETGLSRTISHIDSIMNDLSDAILALSSIGEDTSELESIASTISSTRPTVFEHLSKAVVLRRDKAATATALGSTTASYYNY